MIYEFGDKIFTEDQNSAVKEILKYYRNNGYAVVNFLYFANIVSNNLLKPEKRNSDQEKYQKALLQGSFLLPDGIALRLYLKRKKGKDVYNLNGTDFTVFLLNQLDSSETQIFMYGTDDQTVEKAKNYVEEKYGFQVGYKQDGYSELDFENLPFDETKKMKLLLVARGSPRQENRIIDNWQKVQEKKLLVLNVGGLFDFWGGKEKRAPLFLRKMKLEWLRRLITNPRKNFKKVGYSLAVFKEIL